MTHPDITEVLNPYVDLDFVDHVEIFSSASGYSLKVNGYVVSNNLDFDDSLAFLNFVLSFFDTPMNYKHFGSWLKFLSLDPDSVDVDTLHATARSN